jgi:quercetin dioxygenase-like cupin family protein
VEPSRGESSAVWFAGALVVVHVQAQDSARRVGVWESVESRGDRLPLHVHHREHEHVVLLQGQITFWVGGEVHHLSSQATLALPRGVPHAHRVTSEKARVLTVATPAGFERLFTDLGVPALPGTTAPPRPDDATLDAAVALLGVQIVGPPAEWTDPAAEPTPRRSLHNPRVNSAIACFSASHAAANGQTQPRPACAPAKRRFSLDERASRLARTHAPWRKNEASGLPRW